MMNEEIVDKLFQEFSNRGIQESEIVAAVDCLIREKGYAPSEFEIAMFVQDYLKWRMVSRMQEAGECKVRVTMTAKGKKVVKLRNRVDRIWKLWNERG